jgi:hypothetical protein
MKPVRQEAIMSCGIAAAATILRISHDSALLQFKETRPPDNIHKKYDPLKHGVWAEQIVNVFHKNGLLYTEGPYIDGEVLEQNGVVFFVYDNLYTRGHYLVFFDGMWLDSFINLKECINGNYVDASKSEAGTRDNIHDFNILWVIRPTKSKPMAQTP